MEEAAYVRLLFLPTWYSIMGKVTFSLAIEVYDKAKRILNVLAIKYRITYHSERSCDMFIVSYHYIAATGRALKQWRTSDGKGIPGAVSREQQAIRGTRATDLRQCQFDYAAKSGKPEPG